MTVRRGWEYFPSSENIWLDGRDHAWHCTSAGLIHLNHIADVMGWNSFEQLPLDVVQGYISFAEEDDQERYGYWETGRGRRGLSKTIRAAVWAKTDGHCWYCGALTNPFDDWRPDHVVPVSKGGTNDVANLVPACHRCNSLKSDMSVESFRRYFKGGRFWSEPAGPTLDAAAD